MITCHHESEPNPISHSFLTFLPSFKGDETLLLLCDNEAIAWFIDRLEAGSDFTLGDGSPIASDGACIVLVRLSQADAGARIIRDSSHRFRWLVSAESASHYKHLLRGMLTTQRPCHQYLDLDEGVPTRPVVIVSRGEYDISDFQKKARDIVVERLRNRGPRDRGLETGVGLTRVGNRVNGSQ